MVCIKPWNTVSFVSKFNVDAAGTVAGGSHTTIPPCVVTILHRGVLLSIVQFYWFSANATRIFFLRKIKNKGASIAVVRIQLMGYMIYRQSSVLYSGIAKIV